MNFFSLIFPRSSLFMDFLNFGKPTGKNNMTEFLFSNAAGLSTAKDFFSDNFLKLLEEVIGRAIALWAD